MRSLQVIFCTLLLSFSSKAQLDSSWVGKYTGEMLLYNEGINTGKVKLTLSINEKHQDSVWPFHMLFQSDIYPEVVKDYQLIYSKISKSYLIDEKNGIFIEASLMGNALYEFYEVDGQYFSVTLRKVEQGFIFDLFGASSSPSSETISNPDENNLQFNVLSMKPTFSQSAILLLSND